MTRILVIFIFLFKQQIKYASAYKTFRNATPMNLPEKNYLMKFSQTRLNQIFKVSGEKQIIIYLNKELLLKNYLKYAQVYLLAKFM